MISPKDFGAVGCGAAGQVVAVTDRIIGRRLSPGGKRMQGRVALVCSHVAEIGVFLAAAAALTVGMLGLR